MLKIALTGGIATGKSYVLDQFRRRGVPCLDADELAHGVTAAGTEATAAIADAVRSATFWPPTARRSQEARRRSCSRTPSARRELEAIVASGRLPRDRGRPARVRADRRRRRSRSSTCRCCYETGAEKIFDKVIVTACAPETQVARLLERGLTADGGAPAPGGAVAGRRESAAGRFRDQDRRHVRGDRRAGRTAS